MGGNHSAGRKLARGFKHAVGGVKKAAESGTRAVKQSVTKSYHDVEKAGNHAMHDVSKAVSGSVKKVESGLDTALHPQSLKQLGKHTLEGLKAADKAAIETTKKWDKDSHGALSMGLALLPLAVPEAQAVITAGRVVQDLAETGKVRNGTLLNIAENQLLTGPIGQVYTNLDAIDAGAQALGINQPVTGGLVGVKRKIDGTIKEHTLKRARTAASQRLGKTI